MGEHPAAAGGREPDHQPPLGQPVEMAAERVEIGNRVHPAGPAPEIPLRLFAAEQEFAHDAQLLLADAEPLVGEVPVAGQFAAAKHLGRRAALP